MLKVWLLFVAIASLATADVCSSANLPFSASQNLTVQPYEPYETYSTPKIATFELNVQLYNGSTFHLGPALFRTYRDNRYVNYSISMPEVVYDGPSFDSKSFALYKVVDPCLTDVTHNFAIDFPEAWTNAQSGSVYINKSEVAMMSIREGGSQPLWWPGEGCSVWPDLECSNYFRWDAQPDREISDKSRTGTLFLVVHTARNKSPLSSSLKSMTFRQIGSASCKTGLDEPSTDKDYSFTIDFSNSHEPHRTIVLRDVPQNVSFIISYERKGQDGVVVGFSLQRPRVKWPPNIYIRAASVAIRILKRRQRRALREQYENIPDEGIDEGALLTENKY